MKIYLIYSNTNQYEECNEVLGFKKTEDGAKDIVKELKESYAKARDFHENTILPAEKKFEIDNPAPKSEKYIDYPRWPSGTAQKDITQEMRDERKRIQDKNEMAANKHSAEYNEWLKKELAYLAPLFEPVKNEPWFVKWIDIEDKYVVCHANRLVEGHEYIYELCEELK